MKIVRNFTQNNYDPYADISFTKVMLNGIEIEAPAHWSGSAIRIVSDKYLRKAGVPVELEAIAEAGVPGWLQKRRASKNNTQLKSETSFKQLFHRLAGAWTYWGWKGGYFNSEEDAKVFYDEMRFVLAMQMGAPNSPQWFNTGLHWAYGIDSEANGKQFYVDPNTNEVIRSTSAYERPQPHACFIMSIQDKLIGDDGIMDHWHKEALMFKYGSGVGSNFSNIRGVGEVLSSGGVSSGLPSFLHIGDRSAGAIKSGGTTRRAAKMVILDIDHPDIEWFVNWKTQEEEKIMYIVTGSQNMARHAKKISDAFHSGIQSDLNRRIAIAKSEGMPLNYLDRLLKALQENYPIPPLAIYDMDWRGEAVRTVSGQNSNNSVRITSDFMKLIHSDEEFELKRRTDGSVMKKIKAKDLWDQIAYNAWATADPGVQFHDTINDWHTCPQDGPIRGSNPCSEYMFLDDTACNLASLNIVSFLKDDCFDYHAFEHTATLFTLVLEISVYMAQFPSEAIARRSYDFRTLGLGYANLGGFLMRIGAGYDSDQGRAIASIFTALLTGVAYRTSALIAQELGSFNGFEKNKNDMMRVIRNHARACNARTDKYESLHIEPTRIAKMHNRHYDELLQYVQKLWQETEELGNKYGFRNAQVSVIAPTGTIGLVMDCDTTGCEPDFALVKWKGLVEGGGMFIINRSIPYALRKLGYNKVQVDDIEKYIVGNKDLKNTKAPINANTLQSAGMSQDTINNIVSRIANVYSINDLITKEMLKDEKGINLKEGTSSLESLGFSNQDITESNRFYFGTHTIEGAPHIKDEHLYVFDCANRCGPLSTRNLSWQSHVKMLAAIQPFVSGSISKTVNLNSDATIQDFKDSLEESYKLGVKCLAQYRDGSKSQPLSTFGSAEEVIKDEAVKSAIENMVYDLITTKKISKENVESSIRQAMNQPQRRSLPHRRYGYTQKAYIGGHKILWHTGEYEDGTLGEIFINTHKEGATFRSLLNGFAMLFSTSLQHGVPLKVLIDMFLGTKFEPSGLVNGHPVIKIASSIFDLITQDLAHCYLHNHVDKKKINNSFAFEANKAEVSHKINDVNPLDAFDCRSDNIVHNEEEVGDNTGITYNSVNTGSLCPECGHASVITTGACGTCQRCAYNSGCG